MIIVRVFSRSLQASRGADSTLPMRPRRRAWSMAPRSGAAARGRDRREERHKHNTNASYVQGGWRVVVVVVVVVDAVDLVLGRARRARAAAARRKPRERVHETEARRVEEAVLGRRVALLLGVARAPRLAQIDLRASKHRCLTAVTLRRRTRSRRNECIREYQARYFRRRVARGASRKRLQSLESSRQCPCFARNSGM